MKLKWKISAGGERKIKRFSKLAPTMVMNLIMNEQIVAQNNNDNNNDKSAISNHDTPTTNVLSTF